jgi:hypothetical protein
MSTTVSRRQMQAAMASRRRRTAMAPRTITALSISDSADGPVIAAIERHRAGDVSNALAVKDANVSGSSGSTNQR